VHYKVTSVRSVEEKDEWGAAYGRFYFPPVLPLKDCNDDIGCGGFHGAPAMLVIFADLFVSFDDESVAGAKWKP